MRDLPRFLGLLLIGLLAVVLAGCTGSRGPRSGGGGGGGSSPSPDPDPEPYTYPLAYEWCVDDFDCDVEDVCEWHELTYEDPVDPRRDVTVADGLCTHGCIDDLDCPEDWVTGIPGACYDIGYGFLCYERCFDDFDCPDGFACIDTVGGVRGDAICLPY